MVTPLANDYPLFDHAAAVVMPTRLMVFAMVAAFVMAMMMPIAMTAMIVVVVPMSVAVAIGHGGGDKA